MSPRSRCLATMPVVAVAGLAIGAGIAAQEGLHMGSAALWFCAALCLSSYLSAMLESATLAWLRQDDEGLAGDVVALLWDVPIGALTGFFLARLFDTNVLAPMAYASGILFLQRIILEKLVIGNLVGDSVSALVLGGGGVRALPDFSHAQALAARGELELAAAEFEATIAAAPRDARAYLAYARVLRSGGADAQAAQVLTRALSNAALDTRMREAAMREVCELYMYKLNEPGRAAVLLAKYIDTSGPADVAWAKQLLRTAKQLAAAT